MEAILKENQIEGESAVWYRYLDYTAYRKGNVLITDPAQDDSGSVVCGIIVMALEDYNRCQNTQYTLDSHEVILMTDYAEYPEDTLWLAGEEYKIKQVEKAESTRFVMRSQAIVGGYILIVPDMATLFQLDEAQRQEYGTEYSSQIETYYGVDAALSEEEQNQLRTVAQRPFR